MIALGDDPPINFCKPSVDPLARRRRRRCGARAVWRSSSPAWAPTARSGAADIAAAGGSVIAQDEATSVVWGMPRAVAQAGLCSAVLPLGQIRRRRSIACLRETARDAARLRFPAQDAQGALRPRAVRRQAISGGEPASAGRAQGRLRQPRRTRGRAQARRRRSADDDGGRGDDHQRDVLLSRQDAVREFPRRGIAGAARCAPGLAHASASGAPPPRPGRSLIRSPWRSRRWRTRSPAGASRSSRPISPARCWKRRGRASTASSRCSAGCRFSF